MQYAEYKVNCLMSFGSSRFLFLTLTARAFDKSRNDVHKADENYYPFLMDSWLLKHSEGDKKTENLNTV